MNGILIAFVEGALIQRREDPVLGKLLIYTLEMSAVCLLFGSTSIFCFLF